MSSIDRRSFLKAAAAGLVPLPDLLNGPGPFPGEAPPAAHGAVSHLHPHPPELPPAPSDYPLRPVSLDRVRVTDAFWRPRMEANRSVSLDHCFRRFDDDAVSGVSKLVEGAAHMLVDRPDPDLEAYADRRIEGVIAALDRRIRAPEESVRVSGHFLEAATAYRAATGKAAMLEEAVQLADEMDSVYGPGKETYISGHEGLKIGLVALYRATGDQRYWKLAKFFADERGRDDYPRTGEYARDRTYAQDHAPVVEQTEAVGHCVRATFLYIAMTDLAALAASEPYTRALGRIWEDAVHRKTYLTGGIGSVRFHEQFGEAYELPNLSAWNETCAAYGNAVWNHRMFLLHGDGRYADVMERILYNALLVGVSLEGGRFFYQNPLKSFGDYERFEWINVPCCPPNVVRMVASIGGYVYAVAPSDGLYVNLFVDSDAEVELGATTVRLRQETRYPWNGAVRLRVDPAAPATFAVHLRIPGWARGEVLPGGLYRFTGDGAGEAVPTLRVNGRAVPLRLERGYVPIDRRWSAGDVVELDLPMPVRRVVARPEVEDDRGRVALQRGPLVYCAEWPDNSGGALDLVVPDGVALDSAFRADLLGGVQVVRGDVQAVERTGSGSGAALRTVPRRLTAIPYYAWANRGMGEMAVWLAREPGKAWLPPVLPAGIAGVSTSGGVEKAWTGYNDQNDDLGAVHDGIEPLSSADQSHRYFRMRPPVGERAWLQYDFETPTRLASSRVYFFDDKRFCRLPASWRMLYRADGRWEAVMPREPYEVRKDAWSTVTFESVTTTAVRLEVEPRTVSYEAGQIGPPAAMFIGEDIDWRELGVLEWQVERAP